MGVMEIEEAVSVLIVGGDSSSEELEVKGWLAKNKLQ
jgi:hypothetical protein